MNTEEKTPLFDLENEELLDLFRSTNHANFLEFLDDYEYVEEVLGE